MLIAAIVAFDLWRQSKKAQAPAPAPDSVAPPSDDPARALESLARMRDAGHISAEEYEAKRVELLARL
jgi:hypothetical protein